MLAYLDGNQLIDQNALHENLLSNSVGAFPPDLKNNTNYQIFDKSTVNLVQGRTYTISCKSNGNLYATIFDNNSDDTCFQFYLYTPDHSSYKLVQGNKNGNSLTFVADAIHGNLVLAVQYKLIAYGNDISKFPKVEHVKIERGSKATAWLPSSEDLANIASKMGG